MNGALADFLACKKPGQPIQGAAMRDDVTPGTKVSIESAVLVGVEPRSPVAVGVGVHVLTGGTVGVTVCVGVGVSVGVGLGVSVGVSVGEGVGEYVGVSVGVSVAVGVSLGV
jgi:hypothetical protein